MTAEDKFLIDVTAHALRDAWIARQPFALAQMFPTWEQIAPHMRDAWRERAKDIIDDLDAAGLFIGIRAT